jgi:CO/xanthine dehydrogenase FAD-binding subunit
MSLPAGPMISLSVALDGVYAIRSSEGVERRVPAHEFVTGDHQNILKPGDLLHSIELPVAALKRRTAFRKMSLMRLGRSTALLIGAQQDERFPMTVSAATVHPVKLDFDTVPDAQSLRERLNETIPDPLYHDDVHGTPQYRKHLTHYFAEGIREELGGSR